MRKITLILLLIAAPFVAAAGAWASSGGPHMEKVDIDLSDQESLQRGAKLFVNYCLSCHSARFMRYNRMARDLGIPDEVVKENMMFTTDKIGDLMETTMPADDAKKWFGTAPPDLSVVARARGPEWLYNYFNTFYLDNESPSGWNNLVFENVAMPHALYELQGQRKAVFKEEEGQKVFEKFETVIPGKMSEEEYKGAMRDLTNFMVYMGEPAKMVRGKYGIWVLLFLVVFTVLAYLMKKEFWRDVH